MKTPVEAILEQAGQHAATEAVRRQRHLSKVSVVLMLSGLASSAYQLEASLMTLLPGCDLEDSDG